ncbi:hypothetical protein [Cellulomonas sp. ICMP 17802]|uniref:hypothetical protein n=1 Tax=Cellulomonas sp. ICMP 17802 TaxID=3239199 RepID=UPI00351BBF1B
MTHRHRALSGIGVIGLLGALAACSPAESRGQQRIVAWSVSDDVLHLVINTCNGDPDPDVVETDADVTVTIVSTRRNPGDACQDTVEVTLSEPLGGRTLIDGATGQEPEPMEG